MTIAFAVLVAFADPVEQSYAYPLLAVVAVGGFAAVVRRSVAPAVLAAAFVLAVLPTAGVAGWLGRDDKSRAVGACTAPLAAPFVAEHSLGWTEYEPIDFQVGVTDESKSPQIGVYSYITPFSTNPDALPCAQRAGQRLVTALGLVGLGAVLWVTSARRSTAGFRIRG